RGQSVVMTFRPAKCDHNILPLDKSNFAQSLLKGSDYASGFAGRAAANKTNHRHRRLLRPCRQRPHYRRAAEKRDEMPPPHSITSSARASSVGGISRPSALAVGILMTNSNLVDCTTGSSAGLAPLRMRPT